LILLAGLLLLLLSHQNQGFSIWYATNIYPVFPQTIGWFFGLFPFSVYEILLSLFLLWCCVYTTVNLCSSKGRAKLKTILTPIRIFYILAILFLIFVLTAGINYNRESYADHVGISVRDSSTDELVQLYFLLVERAEVLAGQITTDASGRFLLNRTGLHKNAREALHRLNSAYGGIGAYLPPPKALLLSRSVFSYFRIGGFFSLYTIEANYNADYPDQLIPFIIKHELAHLAGHIREDEASFIAYLAGRHSKNVDFQYSAVYWALSYMLNALHRDLSREQYIELVRLLPHQLRRDFAMAHVYQQDFQGTVSEELSVRINDAYLRLNQQKGGTQSYGRMVDLLLAYYRE
jgi:hypothetical protein